jgi:hypothetical protein
MCPYLFTYILGILMAINNVSCAQALPTKAGAVHTIGKLLIYIRVVEVGGGGVLGAQFQHLQ